MDIYAQLSTWLLGIRSLADLDDFCRRIWKLHGQFTLDDDDAQALAKKADEHRAALKTVRANGPTPFGWLLLPKRKLHHNRSAAAAGSRDPKRWARKRRLGDGAALHPEFRGLFTEGERAALYIVISDWRERGRCDCTVEEIGDRAGVGPTTVRNALRRAAKTGILQVVERRQWRAKNLPNVIKVIHPAQIEWVEKFRPNLGLKKLRIGFNKPKTSETSGRKNRSAQVFHGLESMVRQGFRHLDDPRSGFG